MSNNSHMQKRAEPSLKWNMDGDEAMRVMVAGDWQMLDAPNADSAGLWQVLDATLPLKKIHLDLEGIGRWDTSLVALLYAIIGRARRQDVAWECKNAPEGVQRLLEMALMQEPLPAQKDGEKKPLVEQMGWATLDFYAATERVVGFIGEVVLSVGRLFKGRAYFRREDFVEALADVGPRALPIVTLISFLVGLILAFVGAMQLRQFGAQVFVANLVGIAMAREMGAMMTGIIMAGRTGAAYAARLGTMQVNEEVDALRTNGIEPMDFLTLPRVLALVLMMPLLAVYSVAVGILGGMSIGVFMLDLSVAEYWFQTVKALPLQHLWAGLIKSVVFAFVVAIAGCYHGLRCGRSSEAVGRVTTTAVVTAIVFIIITDSLLTVVYDAIDF